MPCKRESGVIWFSPPSQPPQFFSEVKVQRCHCPSLVQCNVVTLTVTSASVCERKQVTSAFHPLSSAIAASHTFNILPGHRKPLKPGMFI
ncbi:hypothetical protein FKM82_005626 [Ascaphus truei]